MLKTNITSITLKGTSCIENEGNSVQVVTMAATIAEVGHSSISQTITNQSLYDANKDACRADIDEFTAKVREIEDAGIETVTA